MREVSAFARGDNASARAATMKKSWTAFKRFRANEVKVWRSSRFFIFSLRPLFSPELKARTIEGLIRILTKIKGALVEVSET